ncbi:MAG: hypothetical protein CMH14_00480 [Mesonia sp.]|nr:hypothetical protein [Mesonia sp.]
MFTGVRNLSNVIKNFKNQNLEFETVYDNRKSNLISNLVEVDEPNVNFELYNNNLTTLRKNIKFKFSYNVDFNRKISLRSKLYYNNLNIKLEDKFLSNTFSHKLNLFSGNLNLNYDIADGNRLYINTSLKNEIADITDLYQNSILMNVRAIQSKSNNLNMSTNFKLDSRYSYFNQSEFYNIILGTNYEYISSPYALRFRTSNLFNVIQRTPSDFGTNQGSIYTDINKLLYFAKTRIGIRNQLGFTEFSREATARQYLQKTFNYSIGSYLITAFKGWTNFTMNIDYRKTVVPENNFSERFTTENTDFKLSAIIEPRKDLTIKLNYQKIFWPNLSSDFLDFYLEFNPNILPQLSSKLSIRNVFNTESLAYDNFSPTIIEKNTFNIVPRIINFALTWNLTK